MKYLPIKTFTFALLIITSTFAWSNTVDKILAKQQAPVGVVFEIASKKSDLLGHLLPTIKADINRLRERYPGLPIAIVTHGSEQFALTTHNRSKETATHDLVKQLVNADEVNVHVCETHAGWRGIMPEEFPDYVDVSPAGPTQIKDYVELGYELIVLR